MAKVITFGEIMLRLATPGYLRFNQAKQFEATFGGGEANVAVSLANYGLEAEFVTRFPKNDIAESSIKDLHSYGVGTKHCVFGGERLGIYFLETGAVARPSKVVYDRAHSSIATIEKGMNPYQGRMLAMLIFAFFPLAALFAQPLGTISPWWPAILIGLAGAGHQAWSANMYSTIGDMFPKSTVATITGIGGLAAGISSFLINKGAGMLFTYSENTGAAYSFLGFEGKEAGYMTVFCICAVAYLIAWIFMKVLVPVYKKIEA